jgi:uncharacterized protein YbjT (DUF2867 family)
VKESNMQTDRSQERRKIAVAGATGRVGSHLVEVLESQGHDVVAISRSTGVDVITGDGLDEALVGVESIVDAATGPSPEQQAATEFFTTAAHNLQQAGERAGVQRIVVVSIIGSDRFIGGYGAAKLAHEQAMLSGSIPVQILRAAQFHEFVEQLMQWGKQGDVSYVPQMRTQLVAARTVAQALAELALGSDPAATIDDDGRISEIAGPQEENLLDAARLLATRLGDPARVEAFSDPSDPDVVLMESGGVLPGPDAILAGPTFQEWLDAARLPAATGSN